LNLTFSIEDFQRLSLLNFLLRSSMSQERLNGLAILCVDVDTLPMILHLEIPVRIVLYEHLNINKNSFFNEF